MRTGTAGVATTVTSDLLASVTSQLTALGQHYAPVVVATEFDAQAPSTLGFNVRLTTRDVLLAGTDLPPSQLLVTNPQAQQFTAQLALPTPIGPVALTRGWASVDATVDGQSFRLVTTHLDTGQLTPLFQLAQAQELLAKAGATNLPVLYAGDFNSNASNPLDPTYATWAQLTGSGLLDAWATLHPGLPGFTCCQVGDPLDPISALSERIDFALMTSQFTPDDVRLIGSSSANYFANFGFWPSDHAGLLVTIDLPSRMCRGFGLRGRAVSADARRSALLAPCLIIARHRNASEAGTTIRESGRRGVFRSPYRIEVSFDRRFDVCPCLSQVLETMPLRPRDPPRSKTDLKSVHSPRRDANTCDSLPQTVPDDPHCNFLAHPWRAYSMSKRCTLPMAHDFRVGLFPAVSRVCRDDLARLSTGVAPGGGAI